MLTILKKEIEDFSILEMTGRITLGRECQQFEWAIDGLLKTKVKRIVVDLSKVDFLDSTGIGIMVMCGGKARVAESELLLAGAKGVVEQTLQLTRVDKIISAHADVDAAMNWSRTRAGS